MSLTAQVTRVLLYDFEKSHLYNYISVPYGNYGCRGGNMYNAYQYIVSNDGIDCSDSYPYIEYVRLFTSLEHHHADSYHASTFYIYVPVYIQQSSCRFTGDGKGAQISGSVGISSGSEDDLQAAVANIGPIAVAVDASSTAFRVSYCTM